MSEAHETPPEPKGKPTGGEKKPEGAPDHPWYSGEYSLRQQRLGEKFAFKVKQLYQKLGRDLSPRMVVAAFEDDQDSLPRRNYKRGDYSLEDAQLAAQWVADTFAHSGVKAVELDDEAMQHVSTYDQVAELIQEAIEVASETAAATTGKVAK
jgi:hypothetical protein